MGKKVARWAKPDIKNLVADTQASDEDVRGEGVRSFCPCHAGWEVFEQNIRVVLRHLRDPNRAERAHALHVFEDAARMQTAADLSYYVEPGEERIGEKRACARYRSIQERLEARRERKIRKSKRRRGIAVSTDKFSKGLNDEAFVVNTHDCIGVRR